MKKYITFLLNGLFKLIIRLIQLIFRRKRKDELVQTELVQDEAICNCWSCAYIHKKRWNITNLTEEQKKELQEYGEKNNLLNQQL